MNALVFVDSNVLVYARDPRDAAKRIAAIEWLQRLWSEGRGRTSVQVLNDYYAVITKRLQGLQEDIWDDVEQYMASWKPRPLDSEVLRGARDNQARYELDWWDSLVVAAAQVQHCALLLSEDLQDGANYGGVVVRSPFTLKVAEEAGAYAPWPRLPSRHRGRGRPRRNIARGTSTAD